jgi:hypothetical protein
VSRVVAVELAAIVPTYRPTDRPSVPNPAITCVLNGNTTIVSAQTRLISRNASS